MFNTLMDATPTFLWNDELQWYLAADIEDVKDGLLWHEKCAVFLHLSCMACSYLSIPGAYLVSLHLSYVLNHLCHSHNR